ncbi:YaiI/YqxD family protein [Desulfobulbus rhabdoformis]|uniref:YaiI/YqxD family protein n=1 Tax=Desulfobulbus rhabdoformis TaxID=34032 RepID=UPI001964A0BB|nr:YaiI/YqxD family protein [Desulfobulbus rhabdoformis]MBM9613827.1 YaiI/YqxD family protein [Desulfobulbus rhabdoformis]
MHIWVDADACPKAIKEILFRVAERESIFLTLVANQPLATPRLKNINSLRVPAGFDGADNEIVQRLQPGDLVVTADIPLAAQVIAKAGFALNPRGELYTEANIAERLNMRDFMEGLRATGIETGGPSQFGPKDKQNFANQLDRFLSLHYRRAKG